MGILSRINAVVQANLNDMLDKMTDPAKEIDLLVHDMAAAEQQAKQELHAAISALKLEERRLEQLEAEVARWQERAEQAVQAGDDALAREALQHKIGEARKLEQARGEVTEQRTHCDELRRAMRQLELRVGDVKARRETIKQQARAQKRGEEVISGGQAFKDYESIERRIDAMEIEGQLTEELDGARAASEAKFVSMDPKQEKIEDELAALKRKLEEEGE